MSFTESAPGSPRSLTPMQPKHEDVSNLKTMPKGLSASLPDLDSDTWIEVKKRPRPSPSRPKVMPLPYIYMCVCIRSLQRLLCGSHYMACLHFTSPAACSDGAHKRSRCLKRWRETLGWEWDCGSGCSLRTWLADFIKPLGVSCPSAWRPCLVLVPCGSLNVPLGSPVTLHML